MNLHRLSNSTSVESTQVNAGIVETPVCDLIFRVTFEDGSIANEKRTVDGGFDYVDIVDEVGERANTSNFSSEEHHSANIDRLGGKIAAPIESYPSISNRQLKKRLRRQRLGFVVDLRPDLQMAKITEGVYLGEHLCI